MKGKKRVLEYETVLERVPLATGEISVTWPFTFLVRTCT